MTSSPDRRTSGLVPGLVKGLATTARTMTRPAHTHEYPDAAPELPSRSRGVIALLEENCTSCMLCARECPDWCIYIDSHKETVPAAAPGGRDRQRNVLDRFAIDYSLCMYCGICVEVCPFDALFWSPQFEYAETDIRDMLHEKGRLGEWMPTVPPPVPLDPRAADPPELAAADKPARAPRTPRPTREPTADTPPSSATDPTPPAPTVAAPTLAAPTVAAPTVEQPTVAAPIVEQPTVAAPTVAAPTVEQPTVEQPTVEQPTVAVPTAEPTTASAADSPDDDAAESPPRRARLTSAELVRRATEVTEAAERDAGDRRAEEDG